MIEAIKKERPRAEGDDAGNTCLYIYPDVLDEIRYNGRWRDDRLAAGILVGGHFECPETGLTYVQVDGFVAGTHVPELTDLTRYLRTQFKAASAAQRYNFPDGEIVGWYVASTSDEVELDQEALLLHHTFFNHRWQLGLAVPGHTTPRSLTIDGDQIIPGPIATIVPAS